MGELLDACQKETKSAVRYTWVAGEFLEKNGIDPTGLFPWVSASGPAAGASHFQRSAAFGAGLRFRPVAESVRDTMTWVRSLPADRQAKLEGSLPAAKERELLAAWHQR